MENQLFQDLSLDKRAEMLEANAEKVEDLTYSRQLTEEEVYKHRSDFSQLAIEISAKKDEMKEIVDVFKADLKPMEETFKKTLQIIKTRTEPVTERCFILADFQDKMIGTYNSRGELITSRRMTPEEMQMSIHSNRVLKAVNQ